MICSGASIPQGCIIGAGSVVRGSFEPYSIILGNPAKCIKKRFSDEVVDILLQIDFNKLDERIITKHFKELYSPLDLSLAKYLRDEINGK